jgi:uncharacterized membrane protein
MQECNLTKITKRVYIVGFILTFLFFLLNILLPYIIGFFETGIIERKFILIIDVIYEMYGITCHQMPERSFHLFSIPMPLCVRCFGMALGTVTASVISLCRMPQGTLIEKTSTFFFLKKDTDHWWVIWISFALLLPMGLDWGLQQISSYNSPEFMRLITGFMVGYLRGTIFLSLVATFFEHLDDKKKRMKLFERL